MRKIFTTFLISFLLVTNAFAQLAIDQLSLGANAGVNMFSMTNSLFKYQQREFQFGFVGGASVKMRFNVNNVIAELNFAQGGFKSHYDNPHIYDAYHLTFIQMPIYFRYYLSRDYYNYYLDGGFFGSYLNSVERETNDLVGEEYINAKRKITLSISDGNYLYYPFDAGLMFGGGLSKDIDGEGELCTYLRFGYGFFDTIRYSGAKEGDRNLGLNNFNFSFSVTFFIEKGKRIRFRSGPFY